MTDNEKLIDSIRLVVDDYNSNIRSENRDDIDRGEAVAIRRTLRTIGFGLVYNDDKTIRELVLPDYIGVGDAERVQNDF